MKKIPTLFQREFEGHKFVRTTDEVTHGLEWVLEGEGVATVKIDGSCCAVIGGVPHKRYDAKHGKKPPANAIPCCDPDPVTGHWPHWVPLDEKNPADRWFLWAFYPECGPDGTYEAVGPHFQGNPYDLCTDVVVPHGFFKIPDEELTRTFEGIRDYLRVHRDEGIVFWKDGEPRCKIKRSDFGFEWPVKEVKENAEEKL